MYQFIFVVIISLGFILNIEGQPLRQGKDYALFFAVDKYHRKNSDFGDLKNPIKDAETIAKELEEMYGFETHIFRNPNSRKIYEVIEKWQKRKFKEGDQLFVFFSGHGDFNDVFDKGYFIAYGHTSPQGEYIDLTNIRNGINKIKNDHILLVVDACYSGTIDDEIAYRSPGVDSTFRRPGENDLMEQERLIGNQLRNKSRLIVTSGGKNRTPDGVDHSPLSKVIINGLRRAYTKGDGLFFFSDLVALLGRESTKPLAMEMRYHHEGGGFVFVSNEAKKLSETPINNQSLDPPEMIFVEGGEINVRYFTQIKSSSSLQQRFKKLKVDDFYLGKTEVTVGQFSLFISQTFYQTSAEKQRYGSFIKTYLSDSTSMMKHETGVDWRYDAKGEMQTVSESYNYPVVHVSWIDAINYCNWLSDKEALEPVYIITDSGEVKVNWEANGYRLPTETEWEYAARGKGKNYDYAWDDDDIINGNINDIFATSFIPSGDPFKEYSDGYIYRAPVGRFIQGTMGFSDLTGNVSEWCWDYFDDHEHSFLNTYQNKISNPKGPETGTRRIVKGGCFESDKYWSLVYLRSNWAEHDSIGSIGFRVAKNSTSE